MLLSVSCSQNAGTQAQEPLFTMASPDGNLTMGFYMTPEGTPQYSLDFQGRPVVLPSSLGYELRGNLKAQKVVVAPDKVTKEDRDPSYMFNTGFEVLSVDNESVDETWTPVWGEESSIRNNYNFNIICNSFNQTGLCILDILAAPQNLNDQINHITGLDQTFLNLFPVQFFI